MRILYLLYDKQDSLAGFANSKIILPWVDELLDEVAMCKTITIALAVPVNEHKIDKSQRRGVTVYGLPNPEVKSIFKKAYFRFTHATENIKINSYITQVINDFDPDIIQIFGSENPFGLIARSQSKPVIIHIQGFLFVCLGKWFKGISKWEQFRYTSLKNLFFIRGTFSDYFIFKRKAKTEANILKNCKYYMGRTDFDKRIVSLVSPGSKYFHCEEFIRKDFFEKQWDLPYQNEFTCVSILKGTSYKGIDLLVEVLLILKKYSALTFKFKICGVSEDEEIIRIIKTKYRKEIDLIDIEFLGRMSASDLVKELCNANFYVHPSYIENSPNSICEAMALGMPVIATNVGGVSSMIEDRVDGILVQEGEPYSFAGAIVDLTNNYEKAKQLGDNARMKAIKRHKPDDILKNLLKIYETIIYEDGRENLP